MTERIKTIIFDFGNVLGHFNYGPTFDKLRTLTTLSEEEMRRAIDASDLPDEFERGRVTSDEFLDHLIQICQLRPDCDRALLTAAWTDIFTANADVCNLIPQLKPRHRVLLGSNTNELHARHYRRQFADVFRHFDAFVLSYEVGAMKPHESFYRRCVELAGCRPAECLFIDDLAVNIDGAQACGLKGIVYQEETDLRVELQALGIELR